ncbi:MAG: hypothetical protein ACFFDN_26155, partial [Candidatus Hodarchaeota archaeon]
GCAVLCLFLGIMFFLWGYYHFFIYEFGIEDFIIYKITILSGEFGFVGLLFFSEKLIQRTKYAFTVIFLGSNFYAIIFLNTISTLRVYSYIFLGSIGVVATLILIYFIIAKTAGELRHQMSLIFIFMLGFFFFYLFNNPSIAILLKVSKEVLALITYTGSIIMFIISGVILLGIESFSEYDWRENMKEFYIFTLDGINILHYSFDIKVFSQDKTLITTGLTGVRDILKDMVESEHQLEVIDHGDIKILLEYSTNFMLALVVSLDLKIYRVKLKEFEAEFGSLFREVFLHWSGDTRFFLPAIKIVENKFF